MPGWTSPLCHDLKDYTHGDHLAAVRANHAQFLVIPSPGREALCHAFVSRFATRFPVQVVVLESSGPTRFWENLFFCCNTAEALSTQLGFAGLRPPRDPEVHSWRGWGTLI